MLQTSPTHQPRRLSHGGLIDRSRPLLFRFNGQSYQGYDGDTLASALIANDVLLVARSSQYHRPRGIVSAGADEPNAHIELQVELAGHPALATTTPLFDGLVANSINHWPSLGFDVLAATPFLPASVGSALGKLITLPAPAGDAPADRAFAFCDVLVIGGGAVGLMAALAAGRSKARVILVDSDIRLGGRLLSDRNTINQLPAADWADETIDQLDAMPNVRIMLRSAWIAQPSSPTVSVVEHLADNAPLSQPSLRHWSITTKQCIIATGLVERPLVFANNDRPGIMLAGAVRTYLNRYAVAPGERVILYATDDDDAAATIADITLHGAIVEAIIDPRRIPSAVVAVAAERVGAEVVQGTVSRATGSRRVEGVEVRSLTGTVRAFECDLVAMSDGWCPAQPASVVSADGRQQLKLNSTRLPDCLAAGLAAGLAAAAKVGFPDALIDPPETDDEGHPSGAVPWPYGSPLRGLASRSRRHGPAFADFAADTVAEAPMPFAAATHAGGTDLATFSAPPEHAGCFPLVPPPLPPHLRLMVEDVFSPSGVLQRFGRSSGRAGVTVARRRHVAVARLAARPGKSAALAARIAERSGITLPPPGRAIVAGHLGFASTTPAAWLATAIEEDGASFAQQLALDLDSFADITDATADVAIVVVDGPNSRDCLAKGLELDTDAAAFPSGHCVNARLGRMMVTVSSISAGTTFQLVIDSSDLPEFANWLAAAGTEFGLETT